MKVSIIVTSPLQIILAKKVCQNIARAEVECHIITHKGDVRLEKTLQLAKRYSYRIILHRPGKVFGNRYFFFVRMLLSVFVHKRFDYAIIGWYSSKYSHLLASEQLKNGATILYVDDGTATFELEDNALMNSRFQTLGWKFIYCILDMRRILHKDYYSIFHKIKSDKYMIKPLDFISQGISNIKGVYILGTNPNMYMKNFNPEMDPFDFESLMRKLFEFVKEHYKNEKVVFTPHGRDNSDLPKILCKEYGFSYQLSNISVEVDYSSANIYPKAIVGFTSTALFTLKSIFPQSEVVDFRPKGIIYKNFEKNESILAGLKTFGINSLTY